MRVRNLCQSNYFEVKNSKETYALNMQILIGYRTNIDYVN